MIKITIITLTFNSERFLPETISSIKSQLGIGTDFELEHLFVHATSSDSTLDIIRHYQEEVPYSVRIVDDSDKKGITNALNIGVQFASGDVINFLHSDDFFYENDVLQTVASYFAQPKHRRWVYSSFKLCDEKSNITHSLRRPFSYKQLREFCVVPHPTVFMEKSVFKDFGVFNCDYKCAMDYEYWFRISLKCRPFTFTNQFFSAFRIHSESTTEKMMQISSDESELIKRTYKNEYKNIFKILVAYLR